MAKYGKEHPDVKAAWASCIIDITNKYLSPDDDDAEITALTSICQNKACLNSMDKAFKKCGYNKAQLGE